MSIGRSDRVGPGRRWYRVALPPGKSPVPARLRLSGRFGLGDAEFSDKGVKDKLQELSRRSQGKKTEEMDDRVLSKLHGTFAFKSGLFDLRDISFAVPGASVAMAGTYQLEQKILDFRGMLKMDASLSKAVGGVKSIFLKVVDPLFRKEGAGQSTSTGTGALNPPIDLTIPHAISIAAGSLSTPIKCPGAPRRLAIS